METATPPDATLPHLGREPELAALAALLDHTSTGTGAVAFVEGEPGIGKTRLLSEILARAAAAGFATYRGACEALERTRPFGPFADALALSAGSPDAARRDIAVLLGGADSETPAVPPSAAPDVGYRVIELLAGLLEELALSRPVALAIDDLQWADTSTLRALQSLARHLRHLPVMLVATLHPIPRSAEIGGLLDVMLADGAHHLALAPLMPEAASRLAENVLGLPLGESLLAQIAGAGGNPLYVTELIRALRDDGSIEVVGGRAEARAAPLPPSLRLTILRRISFLPEPTLDVLRPASVLGSAFTVESLSIMTGRSAVDLVSSLHPAIAAGLVTGAGERLAFRHDLIRAAVYEDLPLAVRKALHLEAARRLIAAGVPVGEVAQHVSLGAAQCDEQAAHWLHHAARQAVFLAPTLAADLYQRACDLLPPAHAQRDEWIAEMILPLELAGRGEQLEQLADQILVRCPSPRVEYLLRRGIAYSLLARGRPAAALEHYEIVTNMPPMKAWASSAEGDHAVDLANSALARLNLGDLQGSRAQADEALAIAGRAGDHFAGSIARLPHLLGHELSGDLTEALGEASELMRECTNHPSALFANFWAHLFVGLTLLDADRFDEAEQTLQAGLHLVEEQARRSQIPLYHMALALRRYLAGEWDDATVELDAALDLVGRDAGHWTVQYACGLQAAIAVHRGDIQAAAAAFQHGQEELARTGPQMGSDLLVAAHALLLDANGATDEAVSTMEMAWDLLGPLRYLWGTWRSNATRLVRMAMTGGRTEQARVVTEEAEAAGQRTPDVPSAQAAALCCRGLLEADPEILLRSVEAYRRSPRVFDLALAAEDAAVTLASVGRLVEARALFDEAVGIYETVGAARDVARLTSRMRTAGLQRGQRGPRRRATNGWDSLTPTELVVAKLVAEGLTNRKIAERLFVSRYTIETHMRHVLSKLGAESRAEVAAEAARRGT